MSDPEFSRPVRIDTLGGAARPIAIEAEESERAALARRFGLLGIETLTATAELSRDGEAILAKGGLKAGVVQACVASGAPVPAQIDEPFVLRFVPQADDVAEPEVELAEADLDVVPYEGGAIDLGEAVAQTLALALDPFPRASDADAVLREAGVIGEEDAGPFAALKALRGKL